MHDSIPIISDDALTCVVQTLGNHEFDHGPQQLSYFIGNLSFPMLGACNIDTSGEPSLRDKLKQHVVLQHGAFKVGISSTLCLQLS